MQLCHFARHHDVTATAENFTNVLECVDQPMRSFIKDVRARRTLDGFECTAAIAAFSRQKTTEAKGIRGQAAGYEGGKKGRRPGNRHNRQVMADGERNQAEAGVRNSRHAGVRDQRDAGALLHFLHQFGGPRHLIMFVVTDGAGGDAVMIQQFLGLARVFACDHINFFEHANGAKSNVLEIADGCGDQIERRTDARGIRGSNQGKIRAFAYRLFVLRWLFCGLHARSLPPAAGVTFEPLWQSTFTRSLRFWWFLFFWRLPLAWRLLRGWWRRRRLAQIRSGRTGEYLAQKRQGHGRSENDAIVFLPDLQAVEELFHVGVGAMSPNRGLGTVSHR